MEARHRIRTAMPSHSIDNVPSAVFIRREAGGHFTIGPFKGPPQIEAVDFEHALHTAGRYAAREGSDIWYASTPAKAGRLADLVAIRTLWNEYVELPALRLTWNQIRRLLAVDAETCTAVIAVLMEVGLLRRSCDGTFERSHQHHGSIPAPRRRRLSPQRAR